MHASLNVSREVQINIGRFVSVESKEGLKHNIVSVCLVFGSALGTFFIGQVKARPHTAVGEELIVLACGIGTVVVRRQRIDLGNTCHGGYEGGSNRSAGAYQISLLLTVMYQSLGNQIKHGKAVFDNGCKFSFQTRRNQLGQRVSVHALGSFPAHILQLLLGSFHFGGIGSLRNGTHGLDHICDQVCVGDNYLVCLFFAKISEFLQHFIGGTEIDAYVLVKVLEFHSRHEDLAVKLVLLVQEMRVTGGANRLVVFLAQLYNTAV